MDVSIINTSKFELPIYETIGAAGMDIRANTSEPIELAALARKLIPTGLYLEIPPGYECQIRPRSGLALKHGISVLNSPGTIDSDYRGEIGVVLINHSDKLFVLNPGDRIAQMVFNKIECVQWNEKKEIDKTDRGSAGFGSTGKN